MIRLAATASNAQPRIGLPVAVPGGVGPASPAASAGPNPSNRIGWPIPPATGAVQVIGSNPLVLDSNPAACIRYVVAEYGPADPALAGPFPMPFRTLNVTPLKASVILGAIPAGDWVLRVVAYFSTSIAGQEDATVAESYFRVVVNAGALPLPTPGVSPAVACAVAPTGAPAPDVRLLIGSDAPLTGASDVGARAPNVPFTMGSSLELRVDGDVCAHAWSIVIVDPSNAVRGVDQQDNPDNDPFQFAQNRWAITSVPFGVSLLHARIQYSADVEIDRWWQLDVPTPRFPAAVATGPDGATVLVAVDPCNVSLSYPSGPAGYTTCSVIQAPVLGETLNVKAGQPVLLDVPGWTTAYWSGECGRLIDPTVSGEPFLVVDGCDVGGSSVPGPAVFLPRRSAELHRIYLQVTRDGVTASAFLYVPIVVTP